MEFSKKIFFGIAIITMIVIGFAMYLMWVTLDLSSLDTLIIAIFGELSVATGFYFNKSKAENVIKISEGMKKGDYNGRI